jgi:hypothetical protein
MMAWDGGLTAPVSAFCACVTLCVCDTASQPVKTSSGVVGLKCWTGRRQTEWLGFANPTCCGWRARYLAYLVRYPTYVRTCPPSLVYNLLT